MKNLRRMLQLLYKKVSPQAVIEKKIVFDNFKKEEFLRIARAYIFRYSENEAENLWEYFTDMLQKAAPREGRYLGKQLNVFEPLFYYLDKLLHIRDNEILCRYSKMMGWRQLTTELSEDLLVTAYLAREKRYSDVLSRGFSWKRVIGHDNAQLNALVRRGISENHSHLNGAAPIFHISWVSLMNNIDMDQLQKKLKGYDQERRYTNVVYGTNYHETQFYQKYMQAVLIRLLLYCEISKKRMKIGSYIVKTEHIYGLLEFPCLYADGSDEEEEPCLNDAILIDVENWMRREERESFTLREIVGKLVESYSYFKYEGGKRGEGKRNHIWSLNPRLLDLLKASTGSRYISRYQIIRTLQGSDGTAFSGVFLKLLYCVESVSLDEIEGLFREKYDFRILWEQKTLENVKKLLDSPQDLILEEKNIQAIIDAFRFSTLSMGTVKALDYALHDLKFLRTEEEKANFVFSGERWLMYMMFRKIYLNQTELTEYFNLFYAYLLIKEGMRSEMIQSNQNVGFENFNKYQKRKGDFLADDTYRNEFTRLAISENIISRDIEKLELRIPPEIDQRDYLKGIQKLDKMLLPNKEWEDRVFYTVHFLKSKDKWEEDYVGYLKCRHSKKRKDNEIRANGLVWLREHHPETGARIRGIDAAASEIGCRPEVFAPVFRYLKKHRHAYQTPDGLKKVPQLRATYHVGEDFLDLADGLRAIEEAILFLNLESGDRLGHALALGIDVKEWYEKKNYRIVLPTQDYLDNLVWIYHKMFEYDIRGYENLKEWIQSEFSVIFAELYQNNIKKEEIEAIFKTQRKSGSAKHQRMDWGIYNYYHAWKLRGDDPKLYEERYFDEKKYLNTQEMFRVNFQYPQPGNFDLRRIPEIAILYYLYHYNRDIRIEGEKNKERQLSMLYVEAVADIQKALQKDVAKRGIAIETNPSSNFQIGTFRRYEKHPITQFYNKGLVHDPEQIKVCPQIQVSINTDDQGVFGTSLENEYALMACALERAADSKGERLYNRSDIYDWLDQIRIMGNEQSFSK